MSRLDPDFLRAIILMDAFKPDRSIRVQAALLRIACRAEEFDATMLPGEITEGSIQAAGAACGSLVTQGLIVCIGRHKSPDEEAKGRKLNVYRMGEYGRIRAWFEANKLQPPPRPSLQREMVLT